MSAKVKKSKPRKRTATVTPLTPEQEKSAAESIAVSLLHEDTQKRLKRFCQVHHGADITAVLDNAVNDYITLDLQANKGASDAFHAI